MFKNINWFMEAFEQGFFLDSDLVFFFELYEIENE